MMTVLFKLTHPNAQTPTRGTDGAAGFDLYACEPAEVPPHGSAPVRTGVCLAMPAELAVGDSAIRFGIEAQVRGRSGLAFKHDIIAGPLLDDEHTGTIDSDYRGEVGVKLWNKSDQAYQVRVGERVAQLVFAPVIIPELVKTDELPPSKRGANGLGSTGA